MRRGGVLGFIIVSRRVEDYYFIYLFTHQSFLLSNFWLSGRMPPTLRFCGSRQVIFGCPLQWELLPRSFFIISTTLAN